MGDGAGDDAKGRIKEAGGTLTGDDSLKREGKVDQASGKVKDAVGDTADKAKDVVNPDR
jgi:uncharacterized protein YjbJ (UPF0337 family)